MRSLIVACAILVAFTGAAAQEAPHVGFLVGESEYGSDQMMPEFRFELACDLETVTGDVLRTKIHGSMHRTK